MHWCLESTTVMKVCIARVPTKREATLGPLAGRDALELRGDVCLGLRIQPEAVSPLLC